MAIYVVPQGSKGWSHGEYIVPFHLSYMVCGSVLCEKSRLRGGAIVAIRTTEECGVSLWWIYSSTSVFYRVGLCSVRYGEYGAGSWRIYSYDSVLRFVGLCNVRYEI